MSAHNQGRSATGTISRSRAAVAVFSTVAIAILTTYSYLQYFTVPQPLRIESKIDNKNSNVLAQPDNDDHVSDSESDEIDETPPSSPAPPREHGFEIEPPCFTFQIFPPLPREKEEEECLTHREEHRRPELREEAVEERKQAMSTESQRKDVCHELSDESEEEGPKIYREDAIRVFRGFAHNKRSKKGISLKTACLVYKEAWSINKNPRDLILPGRVVQHFKTTLPARRTKNTPKK